jgi:mRNA interferase RelE/StbE
MRYKVEYSPKVEKSLRKMDKHVRNLLYAWIDKNLVGCENPRRLGTSLTGNRSGEWRYRIGDYRLIAEIQDDKVVILLLNAGHRKQIYDI